MFLQLILNVLLSAISGSHGGEYEDDSAWDITPCSLVEVYRRFRGTYCHHQGDDRPDNGNVGQLLRDYMAQYPRRLSSSYMTTFQNRRTLSCINTGTMKMKTAVTTSQAGTSYELCAVMSDLLACRNNGATVSRTRALHCSARERTAEWTRTALIMWRSVVKKPAIGTSARHDSWIMNKLWARCWNSRVLRLKCHQPQEINVSNRLITETSKLQSYVKQGYQMNYWNILHSNDLYNSFCRYDTTIWSHCKHCTKI
jgi:hypothetical protein